MATLTAGRHSAARDGLVPFNDRRRVVRSHRRPRPTLGQLVRTIRERITRRAEGQPETVGATAQPERTASMGMMSEGRWAPTPKPPAYDPEKDVPQHPAAECRDDRCREHFPLMAEIAEAADKAATEQTLFLDPFTVRPYVLRNRK